ncbi:hypothetical protein TCE0_042r14574 [Talaromyces pinophilus]|uniref:Uncharacterized protein n=1 Tax=Talaromyces pinophilus TaxID=128442 RepID=A0A6V8HHZ7_TALPI|nr:hypothetical protein TCE0_042r14574 [Talaromyces pinophilus]
MSRTEQQNKFHRLLGKITRPRNPSKNPQQTKTGNAAENNPQTSSTAVNPTSILDEPHEVSLPRSSVSTLVGDGKNPIVAAQFDIPSKSASIHKALWEKAYSNLRSDKKKREYVTTYEQLLSTVLLNQKIADQGLGEDQMTEIIAQGLKKIEKYKKAIDYSEDKLEAVKAIKSIIEIPLSNIPQTALPWAIISSTIDIFLKPLEVGAEFYNGVGYVVGRIEWYSRFTDQLLSQSSFRNESPLVKIRADIEISITNLYQSLLFYQIKSVCCFYQRHQILVLVRGALRFDNWKGDLDDIKAAEKALRESCDFYSLECLKGQIREISMKHHIQEKVDIFHKRLQAIRHVDPKSIAGTIYKRKEMPIADLYEWIFETDVFKAFAKWGDEDASRRLWISGQAGTGKTMLLLGTIKRIQADGLFQNGREEPPALIYFFCQANDDQLNNGAALWDIVPGTSVDDLDKHVSPIYAFVSSPDGSFVATVAWDDKVKVWDTGASALIHTIEDTNRVRVATMAFSPDNKILAWAGHDGYVMVHNIQKKEPIAQRGAIMNHGAYNTEIQFSRSSRLVAAASKLPRVEVWDTETGILVTQEDQNLEGEELDEFIESWEKILQLNENTTVGCNVSYEMAEPSCKFDISIVGGWIFIGLERSIWLPPERRSQWKFAFEQCNNMLVLATQGGQPLIFWFNPDAMSAKQLQIPSYL